MRSLQFYLYTLSIYLLPCLVFGQTPSVAEDPSLSILPPSPTASALAKYVEFPVDYYSGTPQINIPIHTLSGRSIAVPVSLSYHASGIKVNDVASNVGLGWSLNAGGVISRTILGEADESLSGFMAKGSQVPSSSDINTDLTALEHFASAASVDPWDGQPDIFHFNFGGYSGKFVFDNASEIQIIPHQDLKITYNKTANGFTDFLIITPDGIEYLFGTTEATETSTTTSTKPDGWNGNDCRVKTYGVDFPTAWFLKKIYHPITKDEIIFSYSPKTVTYDLSYNETYQYPNGVLPNECSASPSLTKCVTVKTDAAVYLTKIEGSQGSIVFDNVSRTDVAGETKVSFINIKGKQDDLLKKYKLVQSDITSTGSTPRGTNTFNFKRMYLDTLKEYSAGDVLIKKHSFGYYQRDQLPPRLSYQQDHWGYFNDNPVNATIPVDIFTLIAVKSFNPTFENADRTPSAEKSQYGTLNQITYPTGGTVNYEYEGNEVPYCDDIEIPEEQTVAVSRLYSGGLSIEEIEVITISHPQEVKIDFRVFKIGVMTNGAYVEIRPAGGGPAVFEEDDYDGGNSLTPVCYQDNDKILFLPAGTYEVAAFAGTEDNTLNLGNDCGFNNPTQEYAEISFDYLTTTSEYKENLPTGGIRVSKISYDDGDLITSNNIVRVIEYSKDVNGCMQSTGLELGKSPTYIHNQPSIAPTGQPCDYKECPYKILTSSSLSNIANHSGKIVGYQEVWEKQGESAENGYTYFKYDAILDGNSQLGPNNYGYFLGTPTIDYSYKSGRLVEKKVYNSEDELMFERFNEYELNETVNKHTINAIMAKQLFNKPCTSSNPNEEVVEFAIEWYDVVSQWVYLKNTKDRIYASDGSGNYVESTTNYSYDLANGNYTMPTSISMENSDGQITENSFLYAHDKTGSEFVAMIDKNIIATPVEMIKKVASVQVDGSRTDYDLYNGYPYPIASHRYEGSWNNGVFTPTGSSGGWEKQWEINTYDYTLGLPNKFTKEGWDNSEDYIWTNEGFLQNKTFINFVQSYEYHDDRPLVARSTAIDGQYIDYEYDDALRLKQIFARPKNATTTRPAIPLENDYNIVTTYSYQYATGSGGSMNYVETSTDYDQLTGSGLNIVASRQYLDGLGRPIAEIAIGHSPNNKDVVTIMEYDAQGRITKVYEPFESVHSDGTYVDPPSNHPYTAKVYFNSPLSRLKQVTPPDWNHPTEYAYGSNSAAITIDGTTYGIETLSTETITDGNGHKTITYKDKKGRLIQTERIDGNSASNTTTTRYAYDDKDRLTLVLPPGTSESDNDLIYNYTYDGADNILTKKIPDQDAPVNYLYDNRDLPAYIQDANMGSIDQWLHTKYDNYGRATATGLVTDSSPDVTTPSTFNIPLTITEYDGGTNGTAIEKGKISKSESKILGTTDDWIFTQYTYDDFGRVEKTEGNSHLNPYNQPFPINPTLTEVVDITYDFADNLLTQERAHDGFGIHNIHQRWTYDQSGRNEAHFFKYFKNGESGSEVQLSAQEYTIKDELAINYLGGDANNFLQKNDFEYLPNGFLTGINQNTGNDIDDLFHLELRYDQNITVSDINPQNNGNIAQAIWQVKGSEAKTYGYKYDYLNRITTAAYREYVNGVINQSGISKYFALYGYDERGNLTNLSRIGLDPQNLNTAPNYIDDLQYNYVGGNTSNRLASIDESIIGNRAKYGFNPGAGTGTYSYDANGNLTVDPYKELSIVYNYLNLPSQVNKTGDGTIDWLYDANGTKLQRKVTNNTLTLTGEISSGIYQAAQIEASGTVKANSTVQLIGDISVTLEPGFETESGVDFTAEINAIGENIHDYVGNVEYQNGVLEAIYFEEGRLYFDGSTPRFEFNLKDHLGNTRLIFADLNNDAQVDASEILQEQHYYPFGMEMDGPWKHHPGRANQYQYNGKELNEDLGLNWYAYGARYYDPAIGRFTGVDPISDQFPNLSTYNYASNNPIRFIDLHGLQGVDPQTGESPEQENGVYVNPETGEVEKHRKETNGRVTVFLGDGGGDETVQGLPRLNPTIQYTPLFDHSNGIIEDPTSGIAADAITAAEAIETMIHGGLLLTLIDKYGQKAVEKALSEVVRGLTSKQRSYITPGPFARKGVKGTKSRRFPTSTKKEINDIGKKYGCARCGKKGLNRYVPDHNPPIGLDTKNRKSFMLYPHCGSCSGGQAGTVSGIVKKVGKILKNGN